MIKIINDITLVLAYSVYIVIAYILFALLCGKIEEYLIKRKKRKELKKRKKKIYEDIKISIK